MVSLNKVLLIGNLARDPELRYTPGGAAVCEFTIAVSRKFTGKQGEKEEVAFLDIVAWARQAEVCAEYLKKGRPVFVEGRLTQDRWEDQKTGQKRSRVRITAERVQFMGGAGGGARPQETAPEAAAEAPPPEMAEEAAPPPEDIPF